jgi:hypothetical protein
MSRVLSLRLKDDQMERLKRLARHLDHTPSEAAVRLIEEAFIEFRNSPAGRQAYIMGSSLAIWEVIFVAQAYDLDPARTAEHLDWPIVKVKAALQYAEAFPDEINEAIDENNSYDFTKLKRMLPQAELFVVDFDDPDGAGLESEVMTAGQNVAPAAR